MSAWWAIAIILGGLAVIVFCALVAGSHDDDLHGRDDL